jgi:hypothetical protein
VATINYEHITNFGAISNLTWTSVNSSQLPTTITANSWKIHWSIDFVNGNSFDTASPVYVGGILRESVNGYVYFNSAARAFLWLDGLGYRHITISQECVIVDGSLDSCSDTIQLEAVVDSPSPAMLVAQSNLLIEPIKDGCDVGAASATGSRPSESDFMGNQVSW